MNQGIPSVKFDPVQRIQGALKRGDVAFSLGLIAILVILIMPMPRVLLDASLALSLLFSVMVLMTVLFIEKPLEFSSFPTVLLVTTMLRLALNVASTRLILSNGHEGPQAAGQVIKAFGNFIMGGNFVIGLIVFAILVIVNFVVITKGSGRIAEVSARFSLDAMPGKQMAIDADLSAGLLDEKEAKKRRKELENESNFFGAMDGAAKFVRGDAIAGILITFINVIGGIIIGVAQKGITFQQAAESYTLLTVGDGLVSQIPALIVSTAAGMLVSKSGVEGSTDKALFGQLKAYPTALGMSSFLMMSMSLLPGIPLFPFLSLSVVTGLIAWKLVEKKENQTLQDQRDEENKQRHIKPEDEPISTALEMDQVRLELGYALLSMANSEKGKRLTDQIKALRRQLASEIGFVLPSVRIQDNLQLDSNAYVIRVKEIETGKGDLRPSMLLCMDPQGHAISLSGEDTLEPAFGLKAKWIAHSSREEAERRGYTVVDPSTVVVTHLTEVIRENMADLLTFGALNVLLEGLDKAHKKLLDEMVPQQLSLGSLQRILQNLLSERVSIRDLPTILEALSEITLSKKTLSSITEAVRGRLARQISYAHANEEGVLPLITLSTPWELAFQESIIGEGETRQLAMQPSKLQEFIESCGQKFDEFHFSQESPVLLTSPVVRPFVRSVVARIRPLTVVMSQNEVHPRIKIKTLGSV